MDSRWGTVASRHRRQVRLTIFAGVVGCFLAFAPAPRAELAPISIVGTWEAEVPGEPFAIQITWNVRTRRFEGALVRENTSTREVGFTLGEVCWIATESNRRGVLSLQEERRVGVQGRSSRVSWQGGTVLLDRSTPYELVTTSLRFRRTDLAPQATPPVAPPPVPPVQSAQPSNPATPSVTSDGGAPPVKSRMLKGKMSRETRMALDPEFAAQENAKRAAAAAATEKERKDAAARRIGIDPNLSDEAAEEHAAERRRILAATDKDRRAAESAGIDPAVFGVPLGRLLELPGCPPMTLDGGGLLGAIVGVGGAETCIGDFAGDLGTAIGTAIARQMGGRKGEIATLFPVSIKLAQDKCPDWLQAGGSCVVFGMLKEGILLSTWFLTGAGEDMQKEIADALSEKFKKRPKPATQEMTCTYGYEVKRKGDILEWQLRGLHVGYEGLSASCQGGKVTIETDFAARLMKAAGAAHDASKPKL